MEELKKKVEEKLINEIIAEDNVEVRCVLIDSYAAFVMVGLRQKELEHVIKS